MNLPPIAAALAASWKRTAGVTQIVPAVPSATGVADVFAFQADGTVQAITSGGTTAWTANLNGAYSGQTVPDFQGGLVVANLNQTRQSITKLDGITGQAYPAYRGGSANPLSGTTLNDGVFALSTGRISAKPGD